MEEAALLDALCRGSTEALERLIRAWSPYVVTVIHNRACGVLRPEDEEELASDVFFELWQHAERVLPGALKPWLARVAARRTVDRLRKLRQTVSLEALPCEPGTADEYDRLEQALDAELALRTLPPEDREIFRRFYLLEQSTEEIAAALRLRPATVRTRLRRGRKRLRNAFCQGGQGV